MTAKRIGFLVGALALLASIFLPAPAGMNREAFIVAGLVVLMAAWWMTEALPLTATALMPFVVLPFAGVMNARDTASAYYSPILFLLLGGAFIALAIERTGLHRRLALAILNAIGGRGGQAGLLLAFMIAAAILSMLISSYWAEAAHVRKRGVGKLQGLRNKGLSQGSGRGKGEGVIRNGNH